MCKKVSVLKFATVKKVPVQKRTDPKLAGAKKEPTPNYTNLQGGNYGKKRI